MRQILFEACVDSVESARRAEASGAARLELCSHLEVDGLTPDVAMLRTVLANVKIPVHVMIRVREGAFTASPAELLVMESQIELAARLGVAGVVFGVLDSDLCVHRNSVSRLLEGARPLSVTFHRAFDRVPDQAAALKTLVDLGVDRILTSGGAPTAHEGREELKRLVSLAGSNITIMAAGSIRPNNWHDLVHATGVTEIHGRVPIDVRHGVAPSRNGSEFLK